MDGWNNYDSTWFCFVYYWRLRNGFRIFIHSDNADLYRTGTDLDRKEVKGLNTYEMLLKDSATLRIIEQIIKNHDGATVSDAAKEDKKALNEIRKVIKALYNEN